MATAAFRSTSGRSASGRGGAQRRSRSLSRYSGRFPPPPPEPDFPTPRGRFVNKVRGSGFSDISVDDLAEEFFRARAESDEDCEPSAARTQRRRSVASYLRETESSRQRGRSVSRPPDRRAPPPNGVPDSGSRRRRSMSVARHRRSDSESEMDSLTSSIRNKSRTDVSGIPQQPSLNRPRKNTNLLRSMSQKDFFHSQDSSSSHSSSLTDDEARDIRSKKSGNAKTIQTVDVQEKDVMINEHLDIAGGNGIEPKSSEVLQAIAEIRKSYSAKLEQSEKRKQVLLAQLAMEEAHGQELCKIVNELLPSPKKSAVPERQSRSRRRSNDRTKMSKCLSEEAEKYFEDFLTNVEDTDISSFDGERSDTSSSIKTQGFHNSVAGTPGGLLKTAAQPSDDDGLLLPWLQWETCMGPSPCKIKPEMIVTSENNLSAAAAALPAQVCMCPSSALLTEACAGLSNCSQTASSFGSWSPGGNESSSILSKEVSKCKFEPGNCLGSTSYSRTSTSSFNMDEYLNLKQSEDLLFERLKQRQRIETGSMILCGQLMT